jgi:hypothetical protein
MIVVGGWAISEPFDVSAEPVVITLHDQGTDSAFRHYFSDRRPSTFKFGAGHRIEHTFVH